MIPGSNLLGMALTVIQPQTVIWLQETARTQNAIGQWVTEYATPMPVRGSWQPLDRAKYEQLGLDLAKKYFVFFASIAMTAVERMKAGDVLEFAGNHHHIEDEVDWYIQDGWRGILCIEIGPAS